MSEQPKDAEHHDPDVDFSGSLGMAGHETEDLGWTDQPDDAPVVRHVEELEDEEHEDALEDLALENSYAPMPPLPTEQEPSGGGAP